MTPQRLIEPARLAGTAVLRTQSDDRLVDLVREGNDRAFEAIVHRYRGPLLRYCRRFLSQARAEDAVQQTFVNAVAAIRDGDAEINLRPWLYRIAHNASLNVLRQAGADHEEISEQIDGVETPPQALERGERFRTVVAAVRDLPERQRDAIVLQALEGRSYDEIAVELGVTGGAVRQLLNRARTTLREGVTAITPPTLVARLGGAAEAPVADRVAEVVAGSGGAAALAKVVALVAVSGAVAGGISTGGGGPAPVRDAATSADAAGTKPASGDRVAGTTRPLALASSHRRSGRAAGPRHHAQAGHERHSRAPSSTREHSGEDHSGSRDGGSGGGDSHSGSGGGGSGDSSTTTLLSDDHSGPGGGGSTSGSDGGSGTSGTSGGSSGSDDGHTTTTLSDGSGTSGSSGSGSGDSRISSGSDDGMSGGGTSGSSH